MEYNQHRQDFKNLLNRTLTSIRLNEPNDIGKWVKALLNADNIKLEFESSGKSLTSNYGKTADKVIEFLLYSKFIERCSDGLYLLTDDRGVKLKQAGSFEEYYAEQVKQTDKKKVDALQSDLIRSLDLQLKEQQRRLNVMELNNKPWTFKIAVLALILSAISLLKSLGILSWIWNIVRR
jgi:hypothetical protein